MNSIVSSLALLGLALSAPCCKDDAPFGTPDFDPWAGKPNIIFIVIDTARADRFSYAGCERRTTPCIDELAADSVVFRRAHSVAPWTLPAHMSMFTGQLPGEHGATWAAFSDPPDMTLPEILCRSLKPKEPDRMLARCLKKAGYTTIGISQNPWITEIRGFAEGFDHFAEAWRWLPKATQFNKILPDELKITSRVNIGAAKRSLTLFKKHFAGRDVQEPFFVFFNFIDPHFPYLPPPDFSFRFGGSPKVIPQMYDTKPGWVELGLVSGERWIKPASLLPLYDAEVSYVDFYIGKLIEWLREEGFYEDSMIVLTSDHGEHLGEGGRFSHALSVEEELLQVPLIIKYPGGAGAGTVVDNPLVSNLDIYQTVLSAAHEGRTPAVSRSASQDLSRMDSFNRKALIAEYYYSEAYLQQLLNQNPAFDVESHRLVRRAVYTVGEKYTFIDGDIDKVEPLGDKAPPRDDDLVRNATLRQIRAYIQSVESQSLPQGEGAEQDPELIQALESLGYVGSNPDGKSR